MTTEIYTIAASPTVSIKDIESCRRVIDALRSPEKENVYMNPADFKKLSQSLKDMSDICVLPGIASGLAVFGVQILHDDCISEGTYFLFTKEDFKLYKFLKAHAFVTDDDSVEMIFNLIKQGKIINPLTHDIFGNPLNPPQNT